jgi:DNA-binding transcriptional LysR family regulator
VIAEEHQEMDTRLLSSFVVVAEELHFGRAAERAHLAQPALSRQIQRLEEELGVQLFIRDRRKVVLTEAGRAFLEEARTILDRVSLAQQVACRAARGEIGNLSLGYSEYNVHSLFPEAVRLYRERFPGVVLEMPELVTAQQVEALLGGDIDVGLVTLPVATEGLCVEKVLEEPLGAALPDNHPLASNAQVALEDLANDPFVLFPRWQAPGHHDLITGQCREAGYVPQVVLEANSRQGIMSLVAAGLGVSLLTLNPADSRLQRPGLVYKEIAQPDIRVGTGLAWRAEYETPALKGFLGVAREVAHTYSLREPVRS